MTFPTSPTNNQQTTLNGIVYQYASATASWTRVAGIAGNISATGNISASYFIGNGSQLTGISGVSTLVNGNSNVNIASANANITMSVSGVSNVAVFTSTGVSISGNVVLGNIVNTNANGVGNIGSSTLYFNTIFAKATSALYADLAENYTADREYSTGTVVVFGGNQEITTTTEFADARVAGVISTSPAYLMNAAHDGLPVALRGRVPVMVTGPVIKGDSLVTSSQEGYATSVGLDKTYGQSIFAKALETNTDLGLKVITAVII
jgi:hypothetical protein